MPEDTCEKSRFQDLPWGEKLLLWAFRQWVDTNKNPGGQQATLRKAFCLAGIEEGYLALDELLTVIAVSANTTINVACPRSAGVTEDEGALIGVVASLQKSDLATSSRLLACWLPPSAVRVAQTSAARLARIMTLGGLTLRSSFVMEPPREDGPARASLWLGDKSRPATLH